MTAVLDTHTVLWYLENSKELSPVARATIEGAIRDARDIHVSAISVIEAVYLVEAVQTGFPDCEAKRQIAPERWQRVRIEFEFESRNFRDHGHPSAGCDVIVCWRHNWDECPEHIEVVELSNVINSMANSED